MSTRKRILVLAPRYPYPVVGGDRLRIHQLCKALSEHHELQLLALCDTQDELRLPLPDDGVFTRIERVLLPKWRSRLQVLRGLFSSQPLQLAYYESAAFRRQVASMAADADLVLFHLIRLYPYTQHLRVPVVGELTDAISMNYERVRHAAGRWSLRRAIYALEQPRLLRCECKALQSSSASFLVSQVDVDYLATYCGVDAVRHAVVCSNGVDLRQPVLPRPAAGSVAVFIGNLHSLQNFDAAHWFAAQVLPALRSVMPDFVFRVIGRIRERERAALLAFDGVQVTGEVDEIRPHCLDATMGICSVWMGAGVQNKLLEYMAMGIPAITSPVGLEGLQAVPGQDLLLAGDAAAFREAALALCGQQDLQQRLARNGRAYVERHHSWEALLQPALERVAALLAEAPAARNRAL